MRCSEFTNNKTNYAAEEEADIELAARFDDIFGGGSHCCCFQSSALVHNDLAAALADSGIGMNSEGEAVIELAGRCADASAAVTTSASKRQRPCRTILALRKKPPPVPPRDLLREAIELQDFSGWSRSADSLLALVKATPPAFTHTEPGTTRKGNEIIATICIVLAVLRNSGRWHQPCGTYHRNPIDPHRFTSTYPSFEFQFDPKQLQTPTWHLQK
jgi:hypothetical protein